jgi:hypothetical protein
MNGIGLCLTVIVALSTAAIAKNGSSPLVNFQVSQPLTLPKDVHKCEVPLISRVFGNSYYDPEIVQYTYVCHCIALVVLTHWLSRKTPYGLRNNRYMGRNISELDRHL